MTSLANLTDDDFRSILDDYFAPPQRRQKLTAMEIGEIANRLNALIDVPLITEEREQKILVKVVLKIDSFLYDNLPNEIYDMIRNMDKGIDDKEAARLTARLSKMANDKIDIPYLPEMAEYIAINFVIGHVINSARKKWSLDSYKEVPEQDILAGAV